MCEPYHSIIQYPDSSSSPPDDNLPMSGQLTMEERIKMGLGEKFFSIGRKIKSWFHFSKIGAGHTEGIEFARKQAIVLPTATKYEGVWWDRSFQIDGSYYGFGFEEEVATEAAALYDKQKIFQNMCTFRRFFEQSMRSTDRIGSYIDRFITGVLTVNGQNELISRIYSQFRLRKGAYRNGWGGLYGSLSKVPKEPLIATVMGYTRKRKLLRSHFSDDATLWS